MPDNFTDFNALPSEVTGAIKNFVMRGFPVRLDGPAQVALFAYDNNTFIVESFLPTETDVKISTIGDAKSLKNLMTGETIDGQTPPPPRGGRRQNDGSESRIAFKVHLLPHSYCVFRLEK